MSTRSSVNLLFPTLDFLPGNLKAFGAGEPFPLSSPVSFPPLPHLLDLLGAQREQLPKLVLHQAEERLSHIKVFTLVRLTCEKSLRRSASSWPTPRGQQPPPYCTLEFLPFQHRATTLAPKLSTRVAIIQPKEQQIHIFTKMTSAGTSWISAVSTVSGCICRERNCTTGIDSKSQQADGDPRKEDGERWVAGCPRQHWTGWGGRPPNRVQECAVVHPRFYCASRIITLYTLQRARLYGPTSPCACLPLCHL